LKSTKSCGNFEKRTKKGIGQEKREPNKKRKQGRHIYRVERKEKKDNSEGRK